MPKWSKTATFKIMNSKAWLALNSAGIKNLYEVSRITSEEAMSIPRFGRKSAIFIEERLNEQGLMWRGGVSARHRRPIQDRAA